MLSPMSCKSTMLWGYSTVNGWMLPDGSMTGSYSLSKAPCQRPRCRPWWRPLQIQASPHCLHRLPQGEGQSGSCSVLGGRLRRLPQRRPKSLEASSLWVLQAKGHLLWKDMGLPCMIPVHHLGSIQGPERIPKGCCLLQPLHTSSAVWAWPQRWNCRTCTEAKGFQLCEAFKSFANQILVCEVAQSGKVLLWGTTKWITETATQHNPVPDCKSFGQFTWAIFGAGIDGRFGPESGLVSLSCSGKNPWGFVTQLLVADVQNRIRDSKRAVFNPTKGVSLNLVPEMSWEGQLRKFVEHDHCLGQFGLWTRSRGFLRSLTLVLQEGGKPIRG